MSNPSQWLSATQVVVNDGVNSNFRPDQIGQAQLAWAGNVTIRNGKPQSREYRIIQRAVLPKGLLQGAGYFSQNNGQIVCSIWGQMWRILVNPLTVTVDEIPLEFRNSALLTQAWFCETVGTILIQDGQSNCIIYDGSVATRADPYQSQVPLGRQMAYGNGRLWVAINGNQIVAGDITTTTPGSELLFTENTYLDGGGAFLFKGTINALSFLPINNTFSGLGALMVFGEDYCNSLAAQITSRDQWATVTNPSFESVVLPVGAVSQDAVVKVNQDIYFRDSHGAVWSLRSAVSDQLAPGNAPLSREIARLVDFETDQLLPLSSGIYFNNRIFFLGQPVNNLFGAASFQQMISLDAAPLATMRGKSPPAYDGLADGLQFTRLVTGRFSGSQRAFAFSLDEDGNNRLWEIVSGAGPDGYLDGNPAVTIDNSVTSYLESRRFDFDQPNAKKKLLRCCLWPTSIEESVHIDVYWRTDNRTQWQFWGDLDFCATMDNADASWATLASQERGRVGMLTIPENNDPILNLQEAVGYGFQVRIVWTGKMLLDRLSLWSELLDDPVFSNIPDLSQTCVKNVIVNNDVTYSIPVGSLGRRYVNQAGTPYADSFDIVYTRPA